MSKIRVVFMGSGNFGSCTINSIIEHSDMYDLCCVYTKNPEKNTRNSSWNEIYSIAKMHNIQIETPKTLRKEEIFSEFRELNVDICIVVSYGLIIPKNFLDTPKYGFINVHPSSLPKWRGAAPMQRTIMSGETETEICIMKMDEGVDTGDIIYRKPFHIPKNMNFKTMSNELGKIGAEMILKLLYKIKNNENIDYIKQTDECVSYASKILKDEYQIKDSENGKEIYNKIRALEPGIITKIRNINVTISEADLINMQDFINENQLKNLLVIGNIFSKNDCYHDNCEIVLNDKQISFETVSFQGDKKLYRNGDIIIVDKNKKIFIYCELDDSFLKIIKIKKENSKIMNAVEFLNGLKF